MKHEPFQTKNCDECSKNFIPAAQHLYKIIKNGKTKYYCSYACWRKNGGDNKRRHLQDIAIQKSNKEVNNGEEI